MSGNKETTLMMRLSKGDERAFEELYLGFHGVAYFFVLSFVKASPGISVSGKKSSDCRHIFPLSR